MTTKLSKLLPILGLAAALAFTGCEKDNDPQTTEDAVSTTEELTATEDLIEDTEDQEDLMLETRGNGQDCPTVSIVPDDGSYPRTVTIDYGQDGCEGPLGRIRTGKIIITVSDTMSQTGATRSVTYEDFTVDGAMIEGSKTLTNLGDLSSSVPGLQREVDVTITFPDGTTATRQMDYTLSVIEGADTWTRLDDVLELTGSASGVNRNGVAYSTDITEPLTRRKWCRWIESGVKEVTLGDRNFSIDYGDGTCDRFATLTNADGQTRIIRIRPWWRP